MFVSRLIAVSALLLAMVTLSACTRLPFTAEPIILKCPNYFILEEAATLVSFRDGPGRDLTDVLVRAQIGEMKLGCLSDIDNETNSGKMVVEVSPIIAAEMGPANDTGTSTLPYFVVVTDSEKKILYREALSIDISFEGNKTRVVALAPPTSIDLPITPDIRSRYYRIYSGFELTKEQVEFNRKTIRDRLQ